MGFTTPAFILKNTPELRDKLVRLGYKIGNERYINDYFLATDNDEMFGIDVPFPPEQCNGYIHCGTNETLFLAIAALRDDTNKNQCFTDGNLWFKCGVEMCDETIKYYLNRYNREIHKASIEELMEHFKGKEE
jgi:hypothetical protein